MNNTDDLDEFHDEIAMQIDKRKIQDLIDSGEITPEELESATVHILSSNCDCHLPPDENDRCPKCLTKWTEEPLDE